MTKIKYLLELFSVNKYYRMTNEELENEAGKFKIGNYGVSQGGSTRVDRERIITQLLEKDKANNSRIAILISFFALFISILVAIFK